MKKAIAIYSVAIALLTFLLEWLEYQFVIRAFSTEIYIVAIALTFAGLGIWVGLRLTRAAHKPFRKNHQAIASLGISEREQQVLSLLAEGHSNQEIANRLFVSPNTVKTHLARLYQKLEVSRRTQAIQKSKMLRIIS